MTSLLAHVTPNEFPAGLAMFIAGIAAGIGLTIAVYRWIVGPRSRR